MSPQDIALLQRWNEFKDPDAFTEIVNRYAGLVYGACFRVLRNQSDAEDVAQECFMKIAEAPTKVDTSLGGWLYTAATRRAISLLRSERRRSAREQAYADATPQTKEPMWDDVQLLIDDAIANLPDELRMVIVEHYLLGRTLADLGEEMGVSRQAMHRRLKEGLVRVRAKLREKGVPVTSVLLTSGFTEIAKAQPTDTLQKSLRSAAIGGVDNEVLSRVNPTSITSWMSKPMVAVSVFSLLIIGAGLIWIGSRIKTPASPPAQQNAVLASAQNTDPAQESQALLTALNATQDPSPFDDGAAVDSGTPDFTEFSLERPFPTPGVGSLFYYFDTLDAVGAEFTLNFINWKPWEKVPQTRLTYTQTVPENRVVFFKNLPFGAYLASVRTEGLGVGWATSISEGETGVHVAFPLLPTGTLEFLVTNQDGDRISGAEVIIYQSGLLGGVASFITAPGFGIPTSVDGRVVYPNRIIHSTRYMAKADGYAMTPSDWVDGTRGPHPIVLTEGGVFECRVVDQAGQPVEDVIVHLQGDYYRDHGYARSDSEGVVSVPHLRPETYKVGVYSEEYVLSGSPSAVEIEEGKSVQFGDIEVRPGVEVRGRVFDAVTDLGIPGVRLSVNADIGVAIEDLITDEDGFYSIPNASFTSYGISRRISAEYGMGAGHSLRVQVTPDGVEGETDFALDNGLHVSGRVVDTDGRPVIGAMMSSGYSRNEVKQDTISDRWGRFSLSTIKDPGEIYIKARAAGYGLRTLGPFVVSEEGRSDVEIIMPHASILTGNINVDGRPAPFRTYLWATPVDPSSDESLTGAGRNSTYCGPVRGLYILGWLTPGAYDITVQPPNGATSPVVATVTVREGELVENLTIDYFTSGSAMKGTVTSRAGAPVEFASVNATGGSGSSSSVRATSDANGEFAFSGLSDGQYTIVANHERYSTARVEGVAASAQYVRVVMPDHGTIAGYVRSAASGTPVQRFRIAHVSGLQDSTPVNAPSSLTTIANEDGRFVLDDVNVGDTTLTIFANGHAPAAVQIPDVQENQTTNVGEVVLQPAAILVGRVTDANGDPVRGASLFHSSQARSYSLGGGALVRTDADGRFETNTLTGGEINLAVRHPDYAPAEFAAELIYGETTEVEVVLHGGGSLTGTVFVGDIPQRGCTLVLRRVDGASRGVLQAASDADGQYEFQHVPAGEYTVQAFVRDANGELIGSEEYTIAFNNFGVQVLDWTF